MSADSFHKRVEGEMKKMDTVYDFDDFTQCVDNVGQAIVMGQSDFLNYEKALSESQRSKKTRPLLADVSVV